MEYMFRKRKLLKTLLSLSLLCATVAVLQRLKLGDGVSPGLREAGTGAGSWPEAQSSSSFIISSSSNNNSGPAPPPEESPEAGEASASANASGGPPAWDVTASDCSPNWAVKGLGWFSALDARFQQYVLYRHCRYFPMLLNHPEKCAGRTHLLIVVKSAIEQHDRRDAVRRTWGRERDGASGGGVRTLFLLGAPAAGKDRRNLQKLLEYEDRLFGDILQWDFMDTFFNLTLKEVNFLRWFGVYCRHTRFVFKGDDDVFVNTDNVLEFLASQAAGPRRDDLFVGDIISRALPIRNHQSKYFIPRQLHDQPYPPYAGGGGFLMAGPLARRLAAASEAVQLYPIDDVYLGMCLQKVGVEPQLHYAFRTFGIVKRRVSPMNSDPCFYKNLLVIHKLSPEGLLQMWDTVHNATLTCAKKFFIPLNQ